MKYFCEECGNALTIGETVGVCHDCGGRWKAERYNHDGTVWTVYDVQLEKWLVFGSEEDIKGLAKALNDQEMKFNSIIE